MSKTLVDSRLSLITVLVSVFSATLGCGPSTGESSDGAADAGDSVPQAGVGDSTSTEESTGSDARCGNGAIEQGEWCYERFELSELPFEDPRHFRLAHGETGSGEYFAVFGADMLALSFTPLSSTPLRASVLLERGFFSIPLPLSPVFRTKMYSEGFSRSDFIHWEPELLSTSTNNPDAPQHCQRVHVVPGVDRPPYDGFIGPVISDLDCTRDGMIVPANLDGVGIDEYIGADTNSGRLGVYQRDTTRDDPVLLRTQDLESVSSCRLTQVGAGDVDGDGLDDLALLGVECPAGSPDRLLIVRANGVGGLEETADFTELQRTSTPEDISTLRVADMNADGVADIILAGDGWLSVVSSVQSAHIGMETKLSVAPVPYLPPHENQQHVVRFDLGTFTSSSEQQLLVRTEAGIVVTSHDDSRLGLFDEQSQDHSAADVNGDGLSDVLLIIDGALVFYLSNP